MTQILAICLNPTVDYSSRADVVRPTRKTRLTGTRRDPGGGGVNVARVIAKFGGDVEVAFLAGGETGLMLERLLREEGVACHLWRIAGQTRIGFNVFEASTGLEYRFVPEGPSVSAEDIRPCLDMIASHEARYVVASGSLPPGAPDDTYARMAGLAGRQGAKFVLDSSGAGLQTALRMAKVHLVKPSRGELEALAGRPLDEEGVRRVAQDLVARGAAEMVAVTLGVDGALLATAEGVLRVPAIHVRVQSAVGAGDAFVGAMTWALAEGRAVEDAFRLGLAAGAAAVTTPGTELCRPEDVMALYERGRLG